MRFLELLLTLNPIQWGFPTQPSIARSEYAKYEVKGLPDVPAAEGRSWAGRIHVPGTEKDNSLFFWLYEATDRAFDDNLISKSR